jgi:predicted transcriptional regulator
MREMRRLTLDLSDDMYSLLDKLANRRGATMTEVIKDALLLANWSEKEQEAGATSIYSERSDGNRGEFIPDL